MVSPRRIKASFLLALFAGLVLAPPPAKAGAGNWIKKTISYAELNAAATSDNEVIYVTRGNEVIERVIMQRDVDFAGIVDAGPSVTAATISVGKAGSTTKYLAATDVFTGVSNGYENSVVGTAAGVELRGTSLIATLTTTAANCSVLTAGQVTFYVLVSAAP